MCRYSSPFLAKESADGCGVLFMLSIWVGNCAISLGVLGRIVFEQAARSVDSARFYHGSSFMLSDLEKLILESESETLTFLQSLEKGSSMLTIEVLSICPSNAKQREVFFLFHAEEKVPPVGSRYSKRFSQVFLLILMTRQTISPE
jgi:hypothetical protein